MLTVGSTGDEVAKLQQRLIAAGHDSGDLDGAFGPTTKAALKAFQESKDLDIAGICGPVTLESPSAAIKALTTQGGPAASAAEGVPHHSR